MPLLHKDPGLVARTVRALVPPVADGRTPSAAHVLASLLDLDASVKLAHCLGDKRAPLERALAPTLLGDYVRKRIQSIEDAANRRLSRPFDAVRARVPDLAEVHAQVVAVESKPAAKALAMSLGRTHREYLLVSVGRVRADIGALREEVTHDVQALGHRAMRLEALDAIVRGSVESAMPRLLERAAAALEGAFVRDLTAAIAAFDAASPVDAMAPWFADGGIIGAQLGRTRDLTLGILAREAQVLEALVESACRGQAGDRP